jgi:hypothetical protein
MGLYHHCYSADHLISIEVEELRADVAEGKSKLLGLQEQLLEINTQMQEVVTAVADARRMLHIQKNGTRAEVFRLKGRNRPFTCCGWFVQFCLIFIHAR